MAYGEQRQGRCTPQVARQQGGLPWEAQEQEPGRHREGGHGQTGSSAWDQEEREQAC